MPRSELDRWARTLGVDNDTDAARSLLRLHGRVDGLIGESLELALKMRDCPEIEALSLMAATACDLEELRQEVARVAGKFAQHLRGGDQ